MAIDWNKPIEDENGNACFLTDGRGDHRAPRVVSFTGESYTGNFFTESGYRPYQGTTSAPSGQLRNVPEVPSEPDATGHTLVHPHAVIGHNSGVKAPSYNGDVPVSSFGAAVVNPKELAGSKKPKSWSVMPRWVSLAVGRVMSVGAAKYGAFNYRDSAIATSTYEDAMERHAQLWFDGEDNDPETGVSHLASIIASCALLMDAQASGKLHDDRQKTGRVRKVLDGLESLLVSLPLPKPQT